jgi:dTDP-4-dehydrorhamnose reductase
MKVMVLGASGMLGHVVVTYLNDCGHDVISISRRGTFGELPIAIDLENWVQLQVEIEKHSPDWIVNAAGLLNDEVDRNPSSAILINSFLPRKLAEVGTEMRFRLITIGSDCVFEGTKGNYSVYDIPDAESAYGRSKQMGEVSNPRDLTIRTSIIGPEIDPNGRGLLQWFMNQSENADGWATAVWTGVTTLELAKLIESLVSGKVKETGLWHCVPASTITKFDLLQLMNEVFRQSTINVNKVPGLSHDRSLANDRPVAWPVPEYSAMMQELKTWIQEHQYLYQGTVFEFVYKIEDSEKL